MLTCKVRTTHYEMRDERTDLPIRPQNGEQADELAG
jgi:hypothetical protein